MKLDAKLLAEQGTTRETIIRNLSLWRTGKLPGWWNSWEAANYQNAAEDILEEKLALQAQLTTLQADRDFWKLSFEAMAAQEEREEMKKAYAAIQNVKDVKCRHHTEPAMLAMFRLLEGDKP